MIDDADTDEAEFERRWATWTEKVYIPLAHDHLKMICQIWYGRGITRGVKWGANRTIQMLRDADMTAVHDSDTCSCEMCQHAAETERLA